MHGQVPPPPDAATARIVVTGRGVVSAIGGSVADFAASLGESRGGIRRHDAILGAQAAHVGLCDTPRHPAATPDGPPPAWPPGCDRTARLAADAAAQALSEAGLWDGTRLAVPGATVALLLGSSHGGRSQLDAFVADGMDADDPDLARRVLDDAAHQLQSATVATLLGIAGPVLTLSTACSSSGTAIAHGMDLLRSGAVRVVLAGGADAFSRLTLAGFMALGAVADAPCGPFGSTVGISLGEGAAFVVMERHDHAGERGAAALCELYGCATTWDAHHLTAPEPSGDGMRRAIEAALGMARLEPAAMDYISAHGTGTRANDIAETLAIRRVFASLPPPVGASKSFTGHTLGASSATGLLACIAGSLGGWLPPTLNFPEARKGCDLDHVPGAARPAPMRRFLALSAAFGGCNCAIVGGEPGAAPAPLPAAPEGVVITGLGVMSPLGCSAEAAFLSLADAAPAQDGETALVSGFDPRRHLPHGRAGRMNRITQLGIAAVEQALSQAGWTAARRRPTAIGLMVGLSRGAAASFEGYLGSVRGSAWDKASPTFFPNLVMSSVGGQIAVASGLKGGASTLIGEGDVGLALLGAAAASLARQPELDALVVVAADELSPLFLRLGHAAHGAPTRRPAEGAVALVIERAGAAAARGAAALARVSGTAQGFSPAGTPPDAPLERVMREALGRGGAAPHEVGLALASFRHSPQRAAVQQAALASVFADRVPPSAALCARAGWAEASGGMLALAMAVQALRQDQVPALCLPGAANAGPLDTALVAGSSRHGSLCAVVLHAPGRLAA